MRAPASTFPRDPSAVRSRDAARIPVDALELGARVAELQARPLRSSVAIKRRPPGCSCTTSSTLHEIERRRDRGVTRRRAPGVRTPGAGAASTILSQHASFRPRNLPAAGAERHPVFAATDLKSSSRLRP